jgi:hypothetical protein
MRANTAAVRVGRLLEIRVDAGYRTARDVDDLFAVIDAEVGNLPSSTSVVVIADWRRLPVMSEDASERLLRRFHGLHPRIERSGLLASPEASSAALQFLRLIRESKSSKRRMFSDPVELISWLEEVLSLAEASRLRRFLAESHPERVAIARRASSPRDDGGGFEA